MVAVARGEQIGWQNPRLVGTVIAAGFLADPLTLRYAIYARASDDTLTQVYPASVGTSVIASLVAAPGGDRLSVGQYAVTWSVPGSAAIGRYEVRFWYTLVALGPEYVYDRAFEVIAARRLSGPQYASVQDMRDEGVLVGTLADSVLHAKLVRASLLFERYTGRSFEPKFKMVRGDGNGSGTIAVQEPIIAISTVEFVGDRWWIDGEYSVDTLDLRVYNRHLTDGLLDPDDREYPRISYENAAAYYHTRFPQGRQNVRVHGVFGYTDPDGSPTGSTPELVGQAVRLLAMKDLAKLTDTGAREDATRRWKLTGERTRDQQYTMLGGVDAATRGALVGGTTGDPEIDNIIVMYRRPTQIGAA